MSKTELNKETMRQNLPPANLPKPRKQPISSAGIIIRDGSNVEMRRVPNFDQLLQEKNELRSSYQSDTPSSQFNRWPTTTSTASNSSALPPSRLVQGLCRVSRVYQEFHGFREIPARKGIKALL